MTRDTKFEEEFWDTDYTGSQGFEVLLKKMKDGHKVCKDVEDFCKQRTKIEEEYARNLRKLARSMDGQAETGTMRNAWDKLKDETDKLAQEHTDVAKELADQTARLVSFSETNKNKRKQHEDIVRNSIKRRNELYKKTLESKKTYDAKCKDSENWDIMMDTWRSQKQNTVMKPQDWEKHVSKQVKLQLEADKANKAYQEMIQSLEDVRMKWRQDMTNTCKEYEKLEENRIDFLRNEMWVHLNLLSQLYVDNDNHNEEVRKALEKCNIDADIMQFIREKKVGKICHAKYDYEPYISPHTHEVRPVGGEKSNTLSSRPPQPLPSAEPRGVRVLHAYPPPGAKYLTPGQPR